MNVKTGIHKNRLNLRYSEGSKNFKTQLAAAGLAMWLNHFETDVTFDWLSFFEVAYSHFSILRFLKNLWDFRVFELARNCNFVKKAILTPASFWTYIITFITETFITIVNKKPLFLFIKILIWCMKTHWIIITQQWSNTRN